MRHDRHRSIIVAIITLLLLSTVPPSSAGGSNGSFMLSANGNGFYDAHEWTELFRSLVTIAVVLANDEEAKEVWNRKYPGRAPHSTVPNIVPILPGDNLEDCQHGIGQTVKVFPRSSFGKVKGQAKDTHSCNSINENKEENQ